MPTPADMAAHSRRPLTARPLQPARNPIPLALPALPAGTSPRQHWETSVQRSTLHSNARLVALTIAALADWTTADQMPAVEVGPTRLSRASGLGGGLVRTSLIRLQEAGWLQRTPASASHEHGLIQMMLPPAHARE